MINLYLTTNWGKHEMLFSKERTQANLINNTNLFGGLDEVLRNLIISIKTRFNVLFISINPVNIPNIR